jgi:hypothetical protein
VWQGEKGGGQKTWLETLIGKYQGSVEMWSPWTLIGHKWEGAWHECSTVAEGSQPIAVGPATQGLLSTLQKRMHGSSEKPSRIFLADLCE